MDNSALDSPIAVLRMVRVYECTLQSGPEKQTPALGSPLKFSGFPGNGLSSEIWLGSPPDWLPDALRIHSVNSALNVLSLTGQLPPGDRHQQIAAFIPNVKSPIADMIWPISIIIEKPLGAEDGIEPDDSNLVCGISFDAMHFINFVTTFDIENRPMIDRLATYVISNLPENIVNAIAVDKTFCIRDGFYPIALPNMSVSCSSMGTTPVVLDATGWPDASFLCAPECSWLDRANNFYLLARNEPDALKCFLWAFQCIEILANKLVKNISGDDSGLNRASIAAKFEVIISRLSPQTAEYDKGTFRSIKEARNKLAHGAISDPKDLPVQQTIALAKRMVLSAFAHVRHGSLGLLFSP